MSLSTGASVLGVLRAEAVFRRAGARTGRMVRLRGRAAVRNDGTLVLGDRLLMDTIWAPSKLSVGPGGRLTIGSHVFMNEGADIWAAESVEIGDRVLLGPHVTIVDDSAHAISPDLPRKIAPVVVESDVWLGRRSIVMPGVRIGRFSVVGAGAVVTRDVPPCTVVAGVPARVVRHFAAPPDDFRR